MTTQQDLIDGLIARGASEPVAKGIVANMRAESGLNPGINELRPVVKGSRGGYGLNQWTGPRRRQYEAFAKERGKDFSDVETQLDFTFWEFQNTEKRAWEALQGATTAEQAAIIYSNKFLRPGVPHLSKRRQYARELDGLLDSTFTGAAVASGVSSSGGEVSERELKLADLDPNENYTGADFEQVGQSTMPMYRSTADEAEAEVKKAAETPTFWEGALMAVDEGWVATNVARQMGREDHPIDPDFQFNDELWSELTDGLAEPYQEALQDSTSEAHARALAAELRRAQEVDQKLGAMGWEGIGLRIGAAMLDPVAIGASILSEGAAAPVIYGAKVGRLGRFLRAGTAAAAVNAGIDGYLVSQDPTAQWEDIAYSAAAGFVLGGALGSFRKMPEDEAMADAMRHVMEETEAEAAARGLADGTVGAARVEGAMAEELSAAERVRMENENAPETAKPLGLPRMDRVGFLKQSQNGITRRLAGLLGEDAVGNADGSAVVRSASENVALEMRKRMSRFYRDYNEAYTAWRREQGLKWWQAGAGTRATFNKAVGLAVRRELDAANNVHVNRVAARMKEEFRDLLEFGREHNIRGFNEIKENYNYMVRRHNIQRLDDLMTKEFQPGQIHQLVARSLMSANRKWRNKNSGRAMATEELDYEDALAIAEGYIKSIRSRKYGEFHLNRALSGQDTDTLTMMLKDHGMADDEIAKIVDKVRFQVDSSENGRISNAKWRLDLDETFSMELIDRAGNKRTVGIEDFLENDAEFLFSQYTRSVLGAGFMEDALSHFKVPNAAGEMPEHAPSYSVVRGYIAQEAQAKGIDPKTMQREFTYLDNLQKAVAGIPIEAPTSVNEAQRLLRDYNFSRIGGQLGVAQLAEVGNILGNGGLRVMLQNIPALRKIFWSAKNGGFSDDLFNEIEAIWGFGTDLTRSSPHVKMDESLGTFEGRDFKSNALTHLDFGLQQAKIVTSVGSGMAHVNMVLQRLNARVLVQRFMDDATGTRGINAKRLRAMGITDELHERIQAQLRKHVDESTGMLGRKVKRINIHKWDDVDAKNAFINGVDRWAKKSIQENDVGNMPNFMSYELGKTVGQFRSFMMAAYTKQLLSGMHHKDWETFASWASATFFGGLFYVAQTQVNSVGRPDRDKWLADRLSPDKVAAAAFQRAGFSSLIPIGVDFTTGFVGLEPIFDFRSSGLKNGGGLLGTALGNPTGDLLHGIERGVKGITSSILNPDYDFSQQDYKAVTKLFFLQNAFVVRNVLASIGGNFPKYSQ